MKVDTTQMSVIRFNQPKTKTRRNHGTIQTNGESIHNDMIQGIMNRIKMYKNLAETYHDTIQKKIESNQFAGKTF